MTSDAEKSRAGGSCALDFLGDRFLVTAESSFNLAERSPARFRARCNRLLFAYPEMLLAAVKIELTAFIAEWISRLINPVVT